MKNGRKQRDSKRRNILFNRFVTPKCLNCGKHERHFVPPSLGEEGFYTCLK